MPWFKADVVRIEALTVYVEAPSADRAQARKAEWAAFSPPGGRKSAFCSVAPDAVESPPAGAIVIAERDHCLDCGGSAMCGWIDLDGTGQPETRDVQCADCGSRNVYLASERQSHIWPGERAPADASAS